MEVAVVCLLSIFAATLLLGQPVEENKNHKLHIKFKALYEKTGDPNYQRLSNHYHQEWVNETTDG